MTTTVWILLFILAVYLPLAYYTVKGLARVMGLTFWEFVFGYTAWHWHKARGSQNTKHK